MVKTIIALRAIMVKTIIGSCIFSTRKDTVVVLCLANPEYMRRKPLVLFVKNIYKIKIKEDL